MEKVHFSKLETQIVKHRIFICLVWIISVSIYIYFFIVHWLIGIFFLILLPLWGTLICKERLYIPLSKDYFHLIKKKEERKVIAKQFESFNYIHIGELYFLEEFVLFSKWGALFKYDEIVSLKNKKTTIGRNNFQRPAYILEMYLKNGKTHSLLIDTTEISGFETLYRKAVDYLFLKRTSDAS